MSELATAGFPVARIVGLDGMSQPRHRPPRSFPTIRPRPTGSGSSAPRVTPLITERLLEVPSRQDDLTIYGAQMYDCAITIALAADRGGFRAERAARRRPGPVRSRPVAARARRSPTARPSSKAGEDISYAAASGRLEIDAEGDISTARLTTSTVIDGELVDTATGRDRPRWPCARQQFLSRCHRHDAAAAGDEAARLLRRRRHGCPSTKATVEALQAMQARSRRTR